MMLRLLRGERTLAQTQKALFLTIALLFLVVLSLFGLGIIAEEQQISRNHKTIEAIQQSRLESCQRTFNVLTELIAASADGKRLTANQTSELVKFEALVNPKQCDTIVNKAP